MIVILINPIGAISLVDIDGQKYNSLNPTFLEVIYTFNLRDVIFKKQILNTVK